MEENTKNIHDYMRTFMYRGSDNSHYQIGVSYSEKEHRIIIMSGLSRIDDYLGSRFDEVATLVYHKTLKPKGIEPDEIKWVLHNPSFKGFKECFERVYMDWISDKEKYQILLREDISQSDIDRILKGLQPIK